MTNLPNSQTEERCAKCGKCRLVMSHKDLNMAGGHFFIPPSPPEPTGEGAGELPVVPPPLIWALPCPFNKRGVPVLGSFGSRVRNVVVIPVETWTKLCADIPQLAAQKFEVGTYE